MVEEAAEDGHGESDEGGPGAGTEAGDEAGVFGAKDAGAVGDAGDDEAGGDKHGKEHGDERGDDAGEIGDGGEGEAEKGKDCEHHAEGAAGAVSEPAPEEVADLPAEGRDPEELGDLELGEAEGAEIEGRIVEDKAEGEGSECVDEDEAPKAGVGEAGMGYGGLGDFDWFLDGGAAADELPEDEPGEADEAGEPEGSAPAEGLVNGGHDKRGDDGAEGAAGVGKGDAFGAVLRGEGLEGGAEAAGEGGTFAEAEGEAGGKEGDKADGKGVGYAGEGPEGDGDGHGGSNAEAVHPMPPEDVGNHVGDAEAADDVAVLLAGEVHFFEDDGGEEDESVPVDVADEADEEHRQGGDPIVLGRLQQLRIRKIRLVGKGRRFVGWGAGFRKRQGRIET